MSFLVVAFGIAYWIPLSAIPMFFQLIIYLTAFEALCCGSWKSVELISIKYGTMGMKFADNQYVIHEKGPLSDLRIRSRQATLSDCTYFLRQGVDICVLSLPQQTEGSDEVVKDSVSHILYWDFNLEVDLFPHTCLIQVDVRSD